MTQAILKQLQDARQALHLHRYPKSPVDFRCPAKTLQVCQTRCRPSSALCWQRAASSRFCRRRTRTLSAPIPSKVEWLRTNLPETKLLATLTKLYREASTLMTEQGIHALYLGPGFLEWYEGPASDKKR